MLLSLSRERERSFNPCGLDACWAVACRVTKQNARSAPTRFSSREGFLCRGSHLCVCVN